MAISVPKYTIGTISSTNSVHATKSSTPSVRLIGTPRSISAFVRSRSAPSTTRMNKKTVSAFCTFFSKYGRNNTCVTNTIVLSMVRVRPLTKACPPLLLASMIVYTEMRSSFRKRSILSHHFRPVRKGADTTRRTASGGEEAKLADLTTSSTTFFFSLRTLNAAFTPYFTLSLFIDDEAVTGVWKEEEGKREGEVEFDVDSTALSCRNDFISILAILASVCARILRLPLSLPTVWR
mmetsp:Transcript_19809/g.50665  ORF Transcript_19809/g.50665 Transcript_19809/m.50665 type:complete len:236 (-) Transcript_19809:11-718(-)